MKTAFMSFEHEMEDGWYHMKEPIPHGEKENWDIARDAYKFAKEKGWQVVWVGDTTYKPKDIAFDEPHFGV